MPMIELLKLIINQLKAKKVNMKLTKKFIPEGTNCDTGQYFAEGQPSVITVHWVGPFPGQTPDIVRDYWINSGGEASAHYIIKDDECMQCWPENKVAWHAGCTTGNKTSIGIEIIPSNKEGVFSEKSIQTLKELIHTFPKMPIIRHYDWTGKDCPKYYTNTDKWTELLNKIL